MDRRNRVYYLMIGMQIGVLLGASLSWGGLPAGCFFLKIVWRISCGGRNSVYD